MEVVLSCWRFGVWQVKRNRFKMLVVGCAFIGIISRDIVVWEGVGARAGCVESVGGGR